MKKKDIVTKISHDTGISSNLVKAVIDRFVEEITYALEKGERVELRRFGVFKVVYRRGREMLHPRSGEKLIIPERRYPFFKPSKTLKERVQ
ncbi:MAG: integration host factor subunit beta [Caldiserica bacterium]|nr:integration host factor subunit beta [Caldisericota bacterium]